MNRTLSVEHELKFLDVDPALLIERIMELGGRQLRPRHKLCRRTFDIPGAPRGTFLRVRDEGDRVTLTLKQCQPGGDVHELEECVESFQTTATLLEHMGMIPATYEENYRETYELERVLITIDTWPGLAPFIEVEAPDADQLALACGRLQLDMEEGLKGPVDVVYARKGIRIAGIHTLTFETLTNLPMEEASRQG